MAAVALPEEQDERGKVFQWAREKRTRLHITAFLLFSIIVHGSGFYLFKVVYPSPVRVEARPDAITILDTANPAVRSVLQRISDRTIFLMPPSSQSEVRVRLEDHRVRFTPAFQRTELELKAPLLPAAIPGVIEPLEPDHAASDASMPPGGTPPGGTPPGGTPPGGIRVKLDPSLVDRPIAPWSIMDDYLSTAVSLPLLRIDLEIAPDGGVRVTGVRAELEDSEKAELATVIESTLRFVPATGVETGWIEIGGEG
jgi:hypothetical protein